MAINKTLRKHVWNKTGGKCYYCGVNLTKYKGLVEPTTFCVDHILPKAWGETDDGSNLAPACHACNTLKKNRDMENFRLYFSMKNNGIPFFTEDQRQWLIINGCYAPIQEAYESTTFYFETL